MYGILFCVLKADEFNFECCCCYYLSIYLLIRRIYNKILDLACRTGGLEGPARYTSARAKRENEREAPSQDFSGLALHARGRVSRWPY